MTNAEAISLLRGLEKSLDGYCELNEDGKKAFNKAISALEEQEWIPRKERLPKKDDTYLISGKWADGKEAVCECEYLRDDGYFMTSWNFDVIAWKNLPEPYREDGD
jgi:hypothetical protein